MNQVYALQLNTGSGPFEVVGVFGTDGAQAAHVSWVPFVDHATWAQRVDAAKPGVAAGDITWDDAVRFWSESAQTNTSIAPLESDYTGPLHILVEQVLDEILSVPDAAY
ncbi:MAG TPA: hypothetical protein VHD87_15600 [Acidimicrobiales bacterium]|nr:hypothetical protein [Acidimicrobiales bacterium]